MTKRFWSKGIQSLSPYVPGEQIKGRKILKLNTNENPFPPSPMVQKALLNELGHDAASLRLYPSSEMPQLKGVLAEYHGVKADQVFLGNGSDEVLGHAFNALFRHEKPILFPDISYSFYTVYSHLFGIDYKSIPLADDFSIRVDDYLTPENKNNGGIIIANPNAPTGLPMPIQEVVRLAKSNPQSAVVIDEAYVDYGCETAIPYIDECPNLLVVRTFSKSRALAGLRIGYAIGDASLIAALTCVKDSFNSFPVDTLAEAAAIASVKDEPYFEKQRLAIIENREELHQKLVGLGFEVLPSASNFVFAKPPKMQAKDLLEALRKKDVLVRYFSKPERVKDYLRITVGTKDECDQLVAAIKDILKLN